MRHGKLYRIRGFRGPEHRINKLRHLICGLVKFERIETSRAKAHETQKYAERLIRVAKRGDRDIDAMKVADFWLDDKKQAHKLFKVLGPRFAHTEGPYTRMLTMGQLNRKDNSKTSILEFFGNPYPPLRPPKKRNPQWLVNVLVEGAMNDLEKSGTLSKANMGSFWTQFAGPISSEINVDLSQNLDKLSLETNESKSEDEGTPV